ncbi:MAG TPA: DUF1049 domain-containing protein [Isosphaeraceae bacterium]|jgi:uncharacterized integral membrane protein|nr:DUF1049 domain-containing protein [Isosphaeraceae bacterium]
MASPTKTSPYKRRKPSLIRNFWVYRRLVGLAVVLGVLLWFMLINNTPVTVTFPFRLATIESTTGMVILLSALVGSGVTAVVMTVVRAIRTLKDGPGGLDPEGLPAELPEDRPPADYAAKTGDGFPDFH